MSALGRLIEILFVISRRRHETMGNLACELKVSVMTIRRDIDLLSVSGFPIYTKQGQYGGVFVQEGWYFGKMFFTEEDKNFLLELLPDIKVEKRERFLSILKRYSMPNLN